MRDYKIKMEPVPHIAEHAAVKNMLNYLKKHGKDTTKVKIVTAPSGVDLAISFSPVTLTIEETEQLELDRPMPIECATTSLEVTRGVN